MSKEDGAEPPRVERWYFGGVAGAAAVMSTHPLELLKVHLQTQQHTNKTFLQSSAMLWRKNGLRGFYNGLTASVTRQLTYTTTRFAIYDTSKKYITTKSFLSKILLAGASGGIAGVVGVPFDVINVRMQSDMKLPKVDRRNYKCVSDGFKRIYFEEGFLNLLKGAGPAISKSMLATIGQIAVYDQAKTMFLAANFKDTVGLHFMSSLIAGGVAAVITQPLDVVKTVLMSASPGEFKSIKDVIVHINRQGPMAYFKGFVPAFIRVGPHTVIMFIIYEQLRKRFGHVAGQ